MGSRAETRGRRGRLGSFGWKDYRGQMWLSGILLCQRHPGVKTHPTKWTRVRAWSTSRCYGLHSDRTFGVIWTELSSQFGSFITPTIRSFPAPRLPQAAPRLLYPAPRFFAKTSYPALPRPFFRPVAWFSWFDGVPGVEVPRMKWCVREFAAPKKNSRRFMSS